VKRAKLDLPDEQRDSVNEQMTASSDELGWRSTLEKADENPQVMDGSLALLLMVLTVAPMAPRQARSIVQGFI
jgi:hypothetical protein